MPLLHWDHASLEHLGVEAGDVGVDERVAGEQGLIEDDTEAELVGR